MKRFLRGAVNPLYVLVCVLVAVVILILLGVRPTP